MAPKGFLKVLWIASILLVLIGAALLVAFLWFTGEQGNGQAAGDESLPLGQIRLPPGFKIDVYAANVPNAREMTMSSMTSGANPNRSFLIAIFVVGLGILGGVGVIIGLLLWRPGPNVAPEPDLFAQLSTLEADAEQRAKLSAATEAVQAARASGAKDRITSAEAALTDLLIDLDI
jgi:hypothetical protein